MNEAETRAEHIDPALKAAGWGVVEGSRVLRARGDDGTGEAAALDELDAVTAIVTPVPVSSHEQPRADACARTGTHRPARSSRRAGSGLRRGLRLTR